MDAVEQHTSELDTPVDVDGSCALHVATRSGDPSAIQQLVADGGTVNVTDRAGRTPLHLACEDLDPAVVALLLESGADTEVIDSTGSRAVHKAARGLNLEALQALADAGADLSAGDSSMSTPLLVAAEYGCTDIVHFLVNWDPSLINAVNEHDWTAMHVAAHGREKVRNSASRPAKFAGCLEVLLEANADVDPKDMDGKTPLHRAAHVGNHESVAVLIAAGANLSAKDNYRWTPLHYAVQEGHLQVATLLLKAGAAVQEDPPSCMNPLAVATLENQARAAELLVRHKADPNLRGKGAASPMMIARQDPEKYDDILGLFQVGFINFA